MMQNEGLAHPTSKLGLAVCLLFSFLSGWFVCNEYFIVGAEVAKTTPIVFAFLISLIVGLVLSIGLMTPLSTTHRSKLRIALGIVLILSINALFLYIALRVG
ncbi:MAG: hypothetical protein AM324_013450 [Candidatus Thorarchaeota archaeon SMTZ1-83]